MPVPVPFTPRPPRPGRLCDRSEIRPETANPVGPDGTYLPGTYPTLDGVNVFKANDIVVALLQEKARCCIVEKMQHSYPCCWRHKTPIIFRATPQWFVSMDQKGLRAQSLKEIKGVQWIPDWGQARIESMVANRPDWCISRQRTWGVPMSLFVHKDTEELHPRTLELMEEVAKRVEVDGIRRGGISMRKRSSAMKLIST